MHKILNRTHRPSNINILKARDFYFDKARMANNKLRTACLLAPIALSVAGMILGTAINFSEKDEWLDIAVGITAIVAFVIDVFIQKYISDNMDKSNALREEYDVRVLGIKKNIFWGNNSAEEINRLAEVSKYVLDDGKYEVWYREIFTGNDLKNAICLMMDNTIYTFHIYSSYKKKLIGRLILVFSVFILYTIWFLITPDTYFVTMVNPFFLFIAMFDWVKELVGAVIVAENQKSSTERIIDYVSNNKEAILEDEKAQEIVLRNLQDVVYYNRQQSLFIPKRIRKKFLSNDCIFYKHLDFIKTMYWGKNVSKPKEPSDYEICALVKNNPELPADVDEKSVVNLEMLHEELLAMLTDIKELFEKNGIQFLLDGGTLIGAMRKSNHSKFLAWDDDIDISLKSSDVETAMKLIRENLSDKYIVQDCYSEKYYSPRLSRFRVRQMNSKSFIDEKDSELFELYEARGLFIDVYAYSPILCNKITDRVFRRLFIHPIYKKTRRIEKNWITSGKNAKYLKKFDKVKARYLKRVEWYRTHAKDERTYAYEPSYIENLKKPGPYIKKGFLYANADSERNYKWFENANFEIPVDSDGVLSAFYGKNWENSPYKCIEEVLSSVHKDGEDKCAFFYSGDEFDSTEYKHIKNAYINGKTYKVEL